MNAHQLIGGQADTTGRRTLEEADCPRYSTASTAGSTFSPLRFTSRIRALVRSQSTRGHHGAGIVGPRRAGADLAAGPQAGDRANGSGSSAGPDPSS